MNITLTKPKYSKRHIASKLALNIQLQIAQQARTFILVLLVISSLGALSSTPLVQASNCSNTTVPGLVPINDLGTGTFLAYEGGLYPNGRNTIPLGHLNDGLELASQISPRNASGIPTPTGKVVLVSVGMSNTNIETQGLIQLAKNDTALNPSLVIVNGAEGGEDANTLVTNPAPYWAYVDTQLSNAHVTPQQVQAAWLKEADANPTGSQIAYAATLMSQEITILQMMLQQFPNLRLVYVSSRIYAGYASSTLNPEPYAYTSGFSVKWLVEEQLNGTSSLNYKPSQGTVVAPWVAWGPYMWANGLTPRSDSLTWQCSDFQSDGTHPSVPQGQLKVGSMLLSSFKSDPTTTPWFTNQGVTCCANSGGGGVSRFYDV